MKQIIYADNDLMRVVARIPYKSNGYVLLEAIDKGLFKSDGHSTAPVNERTEQDFVDYLNRHKVGNLMIIVSN